MLAQAFGTLIHIPLLAACMSMFPRDPIFAIGFATTCSSLLKLFAVVCLGLTSSDIRESFVFSCDNFWCYSDANEKSNWWKIRFPSLIMFCAEGWAF